MYKTVFTIGEEPNAYIGYCRGRKVEDWNGWVMPYFEIAEALKVMHNNNKDAEFPITYDEETDTFYVPWVDGEQTDEFKGKNYETEEGIKHLYAIGNGLWVWDDESECREGIARLTEEIIYEHDTYDYWDRLGNDREEIVKSIAEELKDAKTFRTVVEIIRNQNLNWEAKFNALQKGGIKI